MFRKIPLDKLYVANFVDETLEFIYIGLSRKVSVIHHFDVKPEKTIFVIVENQENKLVGYMNLFDHKIYYPITSSLTDYEVICDEDANIPTTDGYINFEALSNYTSKYIKPFMSLKLIKKAIDDINRKEDVKVKSLKLD